MQDTQVPSDANSSALSLRQGWLSPWLGLRGALLIRLSLALMVFLTLMRGVFFYLFHSQSTNWDLGSFTKAFYLGAKFDFRVTLVALLPLLLLMWWPWANPAKRPQAANSWALFYSALGAFLLALFFIDLGYYNYLHSRLNATALDFLHEPLISLQMVWQTYPVIPAALGLLVFATLLYFLLRQWVFVLLAEPQSFPWPRRSFAITLLSLGFLLGAHGKLSQYPLRWSEAFFTTDAFTSALALNPVHYFIDTLRARERSYDKNKVREFYYEVANYLGVEDLDSEKLNFARPIVPTPLEFERQPNVVIIIMESLASYKTGFFGHPLNVTPHFDEIASQAVSFSEFYVPSEGTARSIFGFISGIPDVTQRRTSSRNPLIVSQNTVANAFADYDSYYFIGGSANWGNIRGIITHNIPGVNLVEEGAFDSPRTDVWGISDLHLFREAHQVLESRITQRPFFTVIQTAGFHRPYTIPQDRGQFELGTLSPEEVERHGFVSNEEYNSLRFSDYSLGEFFRLARQSSYYDNTLFVIFGDHGLPDYQAEHVSLGRRHHLLERFRVPLVFYSPRLLPEPRKIDMLATSPDILPTVAALMNRSHINTTLGRNLFDPRYDDRRYAFTFVYYGPPHIGLLDDEFYVFGDPRNIEGLYAWRSEEPAKNLKDQYPERFEEMSRLTLGLYETAKFMLHNNPNILPQEQLSKIHPTRPIDHIGPPRSAPDLGVNPGQVPQQDTMQEHYY